jgi:hypothetical protein
VLLNIIGTKHQLVNSRVLNQMTSAWIQRENRITTDNDDYQCLEEGAPMLGGSSAPCDDLG